MIILDSTQAELTRKIFLLEFINTDCRYYRENIAQMQMCSDGLCYGGYLWDCMKIREQITFGHALARLEACGSPFYALWDIHSKDMIPIPNYWKYPKNAVLRVTAQEIRQCIQEFPEDCYFFDESLMWMISLTHEESKPGKRICYLSKKQ